MKRPWVVSSRIVHHRIGVGDYFLPPEDSTLGEVLESNQPCHSPPAFLNASHAARCVARHGVCSHADAVALVIECSIPIV